MHAGSKLLHLPRLLRLNGYPKVNLCAGRHAHSRLTLLRHLTGNGSPGVVLRTEGTRSPAMRVSLVPPQHRYVRPRTGDLGRVWLTGQLAVPTVLQPDGPVAERGAGDQVEPVGLGEHR